MAKDDVAVRFNKVSFEYGHKKPILDEPTNHINFRHLPVIARALDGYKGVMVLVSHVPEFVEQIRIDGTLDLER